MRKIRSGMLHAVLKCAAVARKLIGQPRGQDRQNCIAQKIPDSTRLLLTLVSRLLLVLYECLSIVGSWLTKLNLIDSLCESQ